MNNANATLVAEMQAIVRQAAEPRQPLDSQKGAIGRAATALGLTYRRAFSFWYGHTEKVRVSPEEAARLRAEADRLRLARIERLEREIAELRRQCREIRADRLAAGNRGVSAAVGRSDTAVAPPPLTCGGWG
ncbi:MAG TPA: hypothetical protein VJO13_19305 [Ktedonobacterales bacterium]|nr:hypothetical protein [Ktedonobacterales bacterium]